MTAPYRRAFALLSGLRSAPAFHPTGVMYEGRAEVRGPGPLPLGEVGCLVRLSKGVGTPRGVADLLGIAVRLEHDPPVDVLATSSPGSSLWRRSVLRPARRWGGTTFTSLMPWVRAGRRFVAVLEAPEVGPDSPEPDALLDALPVTFRLRVVGRQGDVQVGTIEVLAPSDRERPAFDPVLHPPPSWRLAPRWLSSLRERAYAGSREGQAADPADGAR
ncbi:hypothetical protein F4692_002761 [Nocardioides cavernae]|uniref:Phosphodiesterase n=1 Tax=Nocardioides cavernae TaxID=1921566 RepID=A0A7Y9H475_9ACTN|nr:hypothetical protein [Nocardioides cavernae]NYE37628.1 hypothetical protein [Nocardioides cavernae]